MSNKEKFIIMVEELAAIAKENHYSESEFNTEYADAMEYFESLKKQKPAKEEKPLSDLAVKIKEYLESEGASDTGYTSKEIAEAIDSNSRSVSGSMRKLINMGIVIRIERGKTISYSIA